MVISEYLRTGYRRVWAERKAVSWASLALISRLAPLSVIPLMLEFSTISDADHYALVLANASILSIVLNFGQVSNMQARFSRSGFASVASQGMYTASAIALSITFMGIAVIDDPVVVIVNVVFSLSMALTAQYNTLLRCLKDFTSAISAEMLRIVLFIAAMIATIEREYLNFATATGVMILYYMAPYIILLSRSQFNLRRTRSVIGEVWTDRSRLFRWTLSAFLSVGAWVVIRYMVSLFGEEGDLARFSAVMSICSAGVIMADLLYIRIGRAIVSHIESGQAGRIIEIMRVVFPIACLGLVFMIVASSGYVYLAHDGNYSLIILSSFLSLGYFLRFFYVFGQQIMIAYGVASSDLAGGVAMMGVALGASWLLIPPTGIVGAGVAFFLTAAAMLVVISWGVRRRGRVV